MRPTVAGAHRIRNGWLVVAEDTQWVYVVTVRPDRTTVLMRGAKT